MQWRCETELVTGALFVSGCSFNTIIDALDAAMRNALNISIIVASINITKTGT